jgi:pimeloyl-ACP methyl ester carboxylesterase
MSAAERPPVAVDGVPITRKLRRAAVAACAAVALTVLAGPSEAGAAYGPGHPKPSVLLVHGAFADGSTWNRVARRLQGDGYEVVVSQIPLTSFADDVAAVQRDLRVLGGPTLVVGHSYAGAVISQAAQNVTSVVGVVYVAATAPDTGEPAGVFNVLAPPLPSQTDFVPIDLPHVGQNGAPFVVIARDRFRRDFCQDCSIPEARLLAAAEVPTNASAFAAPLAGPPAGRQFPAWYAISTRDRVINPAAQAIMARRMDPTGARTIRVKSGHASLITHARRVAAFIERAAR